MLLRPHAGNRHQAAVRQPRQFALHRTGAAAASLISSVAKKLRSGWPNKYASTRCWTVENNASARLVRFWTLETRGFVFVPILGMLMPNMGMFKPVLKSLPLVFRIEDARLGVQQVAEVERRRTGAVLERGAVWVKAPSHLGLKAWHEAPANLLRVCEDAGLDGLVFAWLSHIFASHQCHVSRHVWYCDGRKR